jgi:hypothetical protein
MSVTRLPVAMFILKDCSLCNLRTRLEQQRTDKRVLEVGNENLKLHMNTDDVLVFRTKYAKRQSGGGGGGEQRGFKLRLL